MGGFHGSIEFTSKHGCFLSKHRVNSFVALVRFVSNVRCLVDVVQKNESVNGCMHQGSKSMRVHECCVRVCVGTDVCVRVHVCVNLNVVCVGVYVPMDACACMYV